LRRSLLTYHLLPERVLEHPNIVQIYDYGQEESDHFIVAELVEGTTLRRYLHAKGILDVDRTVIIAHDVALGLAAAHRKGIIHRDVKPANILVGRGGTIKLSDFGIATFYKDVDATQLTKIGAIIGTTLYMAPEQARKKTISPATDIYSLGAVMYEMITGHPPFTGSSALALMLQHIEEPPIPPCQLIPSIPHEVEEIIMRCLVKEPEKRFKNGGALANALERLGDKDFI
jgi:serine/threonine protein kinase